MKNGILFTADLHLRDDTPTCRIDDFQKTQWDKLRQIAEIVRKQKLHWVDCGDIFHKARPSYRLVNEFINRLREWGVCIDAGICGNHDMPTHSFGQLDDSAYGTLLASGVIKQWLWGRPASFEVKNKKFCVWGVNYTEKCYAPNMYGEYTNVLVMHDMFFKDSDNAIPNVEGFYADEFVEKWRSCYSYIFTGHNHKTFYHDTLYNIGCMTRQSADMAKHKPCVCILDYMGVTTRYLLGINKNAVSQAHLDKQAAHEDQISSFVESLENIEDTSLSFERNVQTVISKVKPENEVKQKVQGAME